MIHNMKNNNKQQEIKLSNQIAERLRTARKNAGFRTAKDFAMFHDIPVSTYSQHETGKRNITPEIIITYCAKLEINPNWLLLGNIESINTKHNLISTDHDKNHAVVDLILLKNILIKGESLFANQVLNLSYQELINYCFDIYDIVASLTINLTEKEKIINLIISSYKNVNKDKLSTNKNASSL